jgi:hypothetical protein
MFGWSVVVVVVGYLVLDMTRRLGVRGRVEVSRPGVFCNPRRRIIEL